MRRTASTRSSRAFRSPPTCRRRSSPTRCRSARNTATLFLAGGRERPRARGDRRRHAAAARATRPSASSPARHSRSRAARCRRQEDRRARHQQRRRCHVPQVAEERGCRARRRCTIIETPFPQMKDLIKSGQIDGALAVEPIRSMIVNEGVGQRAAVEYHTAVAEESILAFWTASKKWADKNPQAVAGFRKCLTEGIAWIGANPRSGPRDREEISRLQHAGPAGLERRDQGRGLRAVRRCEPGIGRDAQARGHEELWSGRSDELIEQSQIQEEQA